MSSRSHPGSDASRPRSGILTPDSDRSSYKNADDNDLPGSSRRLERDSRLLPMEGLLNPSIAIKPHPPNLLTKPRLLQPLMLLPREDLPLSYLDLSSPHGGLPSGRFVEAHIRILELEGRLGSNILIARYESTRDAYALERFDRGLFVLCKLGDWVDLQKLSQCATVCCRQRLRVASRPATAVPEPPLVTPELHKENKKRRLAIEELQSMVRKRPRGQSVSVQEQQSCPTPATTPPDNGEHVQPASLAKPQSVNHGENVHGSEPVCTAQLDQAGLSTEGGLLEEQQTAQDIFQHIRAQYLEALYHSMGSLAYFAKGPLSRARAAFHLDCDGNLDMKELIEFLKSLVMTTVILDKKYREAIPEVMAAMKTLVESSGDEDGSRQKKRPKKMKLGKNGFYPGEEDHVKKWWKTHQPEVRDEDTAANPNEVRYHISCLRTRETQLQMIVVFEILALEALRPADNPLDTQLPGLSEGPGEDALDTMPKKRNKHNFPVLLEVHADRLCIWQSTVLDEVKIVAESQGRESQKSGKHSDPLKDFCVDIIVPFFSARLPDVCENINRKLGGPVVISPLKPLHRSSSSKARPKPGTVTKRPVPTKSARTLEKVLSNERLRRSISRGPTDAIAQLRCATAAAIPGFKRETSEPASLSNIPRGHPSSLKERSFNLLSKSYAVNGGLDGSKTQKQALLEVQLQEAISALRKPNRELAGKAIMEAVEKRTSGGGTSQLRKTKKPMRNPLVDRVQVKATPINNRFRDMTTTDSRPMKSLSLSQTKRGDEFESHSSSMIPSSAPKRDLKTGVLDTPRVAATPSVLDKIQTTPLRFPAAPISSQPSATEDVVLGSSPLQARKSAPTRSAATQYLAVPSFARQQRGALADLSPPSNNILFETPVKRTSSPTAPDAETAFPSYSTPAPAGKRPSIYQRLGWDDDDDDLDDLV